MCVPAMEKRNIVFVIMLFCVRLRVRGRERETGIRRNVSYKEKRRILLLMQIRLIRSHDLTINGREVKTLTHHTTNTSSYIVSLL